MNVMENVVETSGFVVAAVCYNTMFDNSLLQYHFFTVVETGYICLYFVLKNECDGNFC